MNLLFSCHNLKRLSLACLSLEPHTIKSICLQNRTLQTLDLETCGCRNQLKSESIPDQLLCWLPVGKVKSISLSCWKPENECTKFKMQSHLCTLVNKSKSNFKTKPVAWQGPKIEGNLKMNSPRFRKNNWVQKYIHYKTSALSKFCMTRNHEKKLCLTLPCARMKCHLPLHHLLPWWFSDLVIPSKSKNHLVHIAVSHNFFTNKI